jgi:hypothetical protein
MVRGRAPILWPPAVTQAFLAQPLDRARIAAAERALTLIVVKETTAVGSIGLGGSSWRRTQKG